MCRTSARGGTQSRSTTLGQPTPATGRRQSAQQQFVTPGPAATPRMAHSRQQAQLQTPSGLSMSAAVSRAPATAVRPGMHSADLTGTVPAHARASDGDMRAKLSAWREQKQQATRTAAKPGVFKEPAPKPTLFKATAATRVSKDPATGKKATSNSSAAGRPLGGERSSSASGVSLSAASRTAAGSVVASPADSSKTDSTAGQPGTASAASPSAFAATMATLQHSGGKPRGGKSSGGSRASASRPSPVPLLPLAQAGISSGMQQPGVGCSPLPAVGSSTKIPKLNLSSLTGSQQQQQQQTGGQLQRQASSRGQQHVPLSSRRLSSSNGGEAGLPDATPRTARDSLPSKVPRTPRAAATPAARQAAATPEGSDRVSRQLDTTKSAAELPHSSPCGAGSGKAPVPKLKLSALTQSPGLDAAGARTAAGGHSCLSARGATARGAAAAAAAHSTPTARRRTSSDGSGAAGTPGSVQQRGRTPRGPAPAAAGRATPRAATSSSGAAAGPAPAPAAKKAGAEKAEEVRHQLRLLRMQHLQLRHLNARMEAALQSKKEKMEASAAAAAAAVVDLSGQLLKVKDQAQQSAWQSQLQQVLQQQKTKLEAFARAQAKHQAHISQLQAACSTALSHVPLLNGATVGHNPEQPDLQALQRQLQHGMQLLAELQPAVQLLISGESCTTSTSSSNSATTAACGLPRSVRASASEVHLHPKGVKDTAALSRELMTVADEECVLLQQLTQQLAELSDLQLYVNSMQVQLRLMN